MQNNPTHAKIKSVAIWFYIIAALQLFSAYSVWSSGQGDQDLAQIAMAFAVADAAIGVLFVVFGYYAAKRQPWAFVAGLVLYAIRSVLQFFEFFNPIVLVLRLFLMFRIFQGWQACVAANQAEKVLVAMKPATPAAPARRFEMPQAPAAPVPAAWTPSRGPQAQTTNADA